MHTSILILGAGQLVLTVAVAYIAWLVRRDARRSTLVSLVKVLNELSERNNKALAVILSLMSSDEFKSSDEEVRSGMIESIDRLRAIQATVTEALLHTLHQCDTELGFAGRLHAAFRSQLDPAAEKEWAKLALQHGASVGR